MASNVKGAKSSPVEVARNTMLGNEAGCRIIDTDEDNIENRIAMKDDPEGLKSGVWDSAAEFRVEHPLT